MSEPLPTPYDITPVPVYFWTPDALTYLYSFLVFLVLALGIFFFFRRKKLLKPADLAAEIQKQFMDIRELLDSSQHQQAFTMLSRICRRFREDSEGDISDRFNNLLGSLKDIRFSPDSSKNITEDDLQYLESTILSKVKKIDELVQ